MKLTVVLFSSLAIASASRAANIAWVSFHSADNMPSAGAASAGFTSAPDIGYTTLLANNGYNVTRFVTKDDPTAADATYLNGFDLVIIGRSVNSGNYQQAGETAFWNSSITVPVIDMAGYTIRSTRLGFTTGSTIPDTTGTISLNVNNPAHAIFAGIALDGANNMINPYADLVVMGTNAWRGISVNTDALAGGGTVLATDGTAGDGAVGGMIIGEWQPGGMMGDATGDVLAGHRLVFLSGSREASGVSSETAGIYDLDPAGQQLFLNAVNYMIPLAVPEPSTLALIATLGGLAFFARRRID